MQKVGFKLSHTHHSEASLFMQNVVATNTNISLSIHLPCRVSSHHIFKSIKSHITFPSESMTTHRSFTTQARPAATNNLSITVPSSAILSSSPPTRPPKSTITMPSTTQAPSPGPASHPHTCRTSRLLRRAYHILHFSRGYNFLLFLILGGTMLGFSLSRLSYLSFSTFCPPPGSKGSGAAPGECYWYTHPSFPRYKIGIILHLATCLPTGILLPLQFIPAIRYRWMGLHRAIGYTVLALTLMSMAGVFMVGNRSFGGALHIRFLVSTLGMAHLGSLALSYYNVKRLRIEEHRAWMLRAWVYVSFSSKKFFNSSSRYFDLTGQSNSMRKG